MAAMMPVPNIKNSSGQLQKTSRALESQWDDWMDWGPSLDKVDGVPKQVMMLSQTDIDEHKPKDSIRLTRKRKSLEDSDCILPSGRSSSVQNKSHSVVEKRYRTNLNDKIAELRQSVPSLREGSQSPEDVAVSSPSLKYNKATILTKAIEYIQHLEKRNAFLEDTNNMLRNHRCDISTTIYEKSPALEKEPSKDGSSISSNSLSRSPSSGITTDEPRGMISVPEDIRRLRESVLPQPHYADSISYETNTEGTSSSNISVRGGKLIGKLMLGSLAGLMIMDGVGGTREGGRDRGLFALPVPSLLPFLRMLWNIQSHPSTLPYNRFLLPLARGFIVFAMLGIILFLYLFNSKPKIGRVRVAFDKSISRDSASPLEMRQNAWLTAIQTVRVPRHTMLPELLALILETHAYLARKVIGWRRYSWLTGRNEEDEVARVRAYDIAIDAQLVGGDTELSRSRLVLTLWASGTLPVSPARLMLKALHIRLTFWQASRSLWITRVIDCAGRHLAYSQWRLAQELIDSPKISKNSGASDPLPNHLVRLLQQPIDEIMTDNAIRNAHNYAWNRDFLDPGDGDCNLHSEDTASLGSLDALAVWVSNSNLHKALSAFVECSVSKTIQSQIALALGTAPPGSLSSIRALTAAAALYEADREVNIACVLQSISLSSDCLLSASSPTVPLIPSDACQDIPIAIDCAQAMIALVSSKSSSSGLPRALEVLEKALSGPRSMKPLARAATYQLMLELAKHPGLLGIASYRFHQVIVNAVMQLDESMPQKLDSHYKIRSNYKIALQKLIQHGTEKRRLSIASVDTGYGSMNDDDHTAMYLAAS